MKSAIAVAALLASLSSNALAQAVPSVEVVATDVVPTNTEVLVTLNDALDSRRVRKGQWFDVSVSRDVMIGNAVVIPRGTPGKGEIVYRTGKGAYGKSGKLELVLRRLDIAGQALPLGGRFREEGQGNTGAVIGTIVLAGLVGGAFVTGHSAIIPQGRELKAFTAEAWRAPSASVRQFAARPIIASVATVAPGMIPTRSTAVWTPPAPDAYSRALAAEQGVHGGNPAQGWTISD